MAFIGNQPTAVPLTSSQLVDGIITTAKIADGAVVNVDVNSTAAIAYSKLNLATSIVNADISASAAIATTKLGAGAVLQVVTATDSTQRSSSSSTFVTASNTLSVSITPSSASNKVLVIATANIATGSGAQGVFTIFRGATNLGNGNGGMTNVITNNYGTITMSILDSPSTTSSTTYQVYGRATSGGSFVINSGAGGDTLGTITALEIKG